ncbi:MAG TPA: tRNA lysidine(34) synthetase TilS [Solirubrobacterales bacterium]|jgi:tRNA(Ile)-lysidine synthase|nr:tRNA lysidine(34) synthetase TilS [Solirubrobacterales bacterium]
MSESALAALVAAVQSSGLVDPESSGVALCSGGADSAALAAGLAGAVGPERVVALHLNYALRPDADEDQRRAEQLCARLGVELVAERPELSEHGNLQAAARDARYAAAERVRAARGLDWIATGHTRTDLAETVLYRLATSPGRRALLGLPARRGAIVRPLLGLDRERVRALALEAGLPFRDDSSNALDVYARNRIRSQVLPALRELGPAAEATIAETRAELAEESETLDRLAAEALEASGAAAAGAIPVEALTALDPALRRLALRALAELAAGRPVPLGRRRAAEIVALTARPEGGTIELGEGVEARVEHGHVRFLLGPEQVPADALLTVPGSCRFGPWEVRAELREGPVDPDGSEQAFLDPAALPDTLVVRSWRDGDRMRPVGLDGSKSLQDLFTDRKIPRSLRRLLPVVTSGDRIAWVAGVAVSGEFAASPDAARAAVLSAGSRPSS